MTSISPVKILNPLLPAPLSKFVAHLKLKESPTEIGEANALETVAVAFDPAGFAYIPKEALGIPVIPASEAFPTKVPAKPVPWEEEIVQFPKPIPPFEPVDQPVP